MEGFEPSFLLLLLFKNYFHFVPLCKSEAVTNSARAAESSELGNVDLHLARMCPGSLFRLLICYLSVYFFFFPESHQRKGTFHIL